MRHAVAAIGETAYGALMVIASIIVILLVVLTLHDLIQRKHAVVRNFPVLGHLRYWIEALGPELRQYVVASNTEERPFNRDQRTWIYASSKKENDYVGFGTDNDLETRPNYIIIKHSPFPLSEARPGEPDYDPSYALPSAKILGGYHGRPKAFRPASVVNLSAMSFGSLSANAVMALNRGAKLAGLLQNTGEGGLSPAHQQGGDLIWQLGTGYFGARDERGKFSLERFRDVVSRHPIRAIEIKLSQGAKPGLGGVLPGAKVTKEISQIRGVPESIDCISPAGHSAFHDVDSLLDFAETLARDSGLPVGIKSAVGELDFWKQLARRMEETGRGVDFITIDGGEGGTGAAPLVFTDHVALPFKMGMSRVYPLFAERGLHHRLTFIGSGKLGFPEAALFAFALGCDMVNIGREAMLSVGCIQAMKCQTNRCPTGVATQSKWLMRGLDPELKSARLANYVTVLRKEILRLSRACGVPHPALVTCDHLEIIDDRFHGAALGEIFDYRPEWSTPSPDDIAEIRRLMTHPRSLAHDPEAPQVEQAPTVRHGVT